MIINTVGIEFARGPSSHPGPGGNWPSTTGQPSGGGRGNGPAGK
jgi:hypothetical protein